VTIETWLRNAVGKLKSASIPTARLDAEILLADMLKKDRSWLHAHPDFRLNDPNTQGGSLGVVRRLNKQIERRVGHEPLAYIRGKQEFYGREFTVSPDTLTPRPETETMVELLLNQIGDLGLGIGERKETGEGRRKTGVEQQIGDRGKESGGELQIVDVGTGSGCIIITTALELSKIQDPRSKIHYTGLDISKAALKIAKHNARKLEVNVNLQHFDLLSDDLSKIQDPRSTIYLANLPYVPEDFRINLAASHEPEFAIFGGKDGLDYYRTLFSKLKNATVILTESLPPQHEQLIQVATEAGYKLHKTQDLIQVFKPT